MNHFYKKYHRLENLIIVAIIKYLNFRKIKFKKVIYMYDKRRLFKIELNNNTYLYLNLNEFGFSYNSNKKTNLSKIHNLLYIIKNDGAMIERYFNILKNTLKERDRIYEKYKQLILSLTDTKFQIVFPKRNIVCDFVKYDSKEDKFTFYQINQANVFKYDLSVLVKDFILENISINSKYFRKNKMKLI